MICRVFDFWSTEDGNNTDASYARVMKALVKLNGKMEGSYTWDPEVKRGFVCYSIKLPAGSKEEFEKISKCKLYRHSDIQVGMDVIKSQKQINYNVSPPQIILNEKDCFKHYLDAEIK